MDDKELYEGFSKEELEAGNKEAKERWGNTDQYKQSVGKYESLTKEQKLQMKKDGDQLMKRHRRCDEERSRKPRGAGASYRGTTTLCDSSTSRIRRCIRDGRYVRGLQG